MAKNLAIQPVIVCDEYDPALHTVDADGVHTYAGPGVIYLADKRPKDADEALAMLLADDDLKDSQYAQDELKKPPDGNDKAWKKLQKDILKILKKTGDDKIDAWIAKHDAKETKK